MAFTSGLRYEQLMLVVTADAFDTLKYTKGSYRSNRGKAQLVLSFQAPDPSSPTGKKQVRLTRTLPEKYDANISDSAKRKLIGEWKDQVLSDAREVRGSEMDTTQTVREVCEKYIADRESKAKTAGHGRGLGIAATTASKWRADVARLDGTLMYDMPVASVTKAMADANVQELCQKYAGESVRACYAVLCMAFRWVLGKHADIVVEDVTLPSLSWYPPCSAKADYEDGLNILSESAMQDFIALCVDSIGGKGEITALGALISVTGGLRSGETCGLRWADVHLDAPVPYLHVQRSVKRYRKDGKWVHEVGDCKSKNSKRKVPLMPVTVDALRKVRASRLELLMASTPTDGKRISIESCYVLGDISGNFRHVNTQIDCFKTFARNHDIIGDKGRHVSMHALRDTFASRLRDRGESDVRIAKLLGHSSVATTRARYFDADQDAVDDAVLGNADLFVPRRAEDSNAEVRTLDCMAV